MSRIDRPKWANLPSREFKAWVREEVQLLLVKLPDGFRHAHLVDRLGPSYAHGQPQERRLRNCLVAMLKAGLLTRASRGLFVSGPKLAEENALGTSVELMDRLYAAFFDSGGIISMRELLVELEREDDNSARLVRTALSNSPIYFSGVPLDGYRAHWLLVDEERKKIPLPGRWHLLELQLMAARMGRASWAWGLNGALSEYRARVATALRDARGLLGADPEDFAVDHEIGEALDLCLLGNDCAIMLRNGDSVAAGVWWSDVVEAVGRATALATAWRMIESCDPIDHHILHALDVQFWLAIGERTRLDPAWLSRGGLALGATADLMLQASPLNRG